jgi:hypothetical protein
LETGWQSGLSSREYLPHKCETLSSNPILTKKNGEITMHEIEKKQRENNFKNLKLTL